MTQSVTESSISPGPLSPFSTYSVASGITSDGKRYCLQVQMMCINCVNNADAPDLGAFGPVFRALTNLQRGQDADLRGATPTSSFALSHSDDSDPLQGPSTWTVRRVPRVTSSLPGSPTPARSSLPPETDETASEYDDGTELEVPIYDVAPMDSQSVDYPTVDRPSLGYLDQALTYIQAEREKFVLRRELRGNGSTTSDSPSQFVLPPTMRRKRRRKRPKPVRRTAQDDDTRVETAVDEGDGVDEGSADNEDGDTSSSSFDAPSSPSRFKTTPSTPATFRREKQKQRAAAEQNPRLHHSRSTPSLQVSTHSFDVRTIQLRTLAHKLRLLFSTEREALTEVLARDFTSSLAYADPRGPVPQSQDTLIHVFIDQCVLLFSCVYLLPLTLICTVVTSVARIFLSDSLITLVDTWPTS